MVKITLRFFFAPLSPFDEGKTPAEIAEKMNCSRQLVYKIVNNGTVNNNEKKEKSVNVDKKSVNSLQKSVNNTVNTVICKQTLLLLFGLSELP
ncbi:MAG: helix-turn-helix domain-containing protein [Treponema sp.]|nr:helix-turn-helix domain-containing protein [Treponema sp.]